MRGVYRWDGGDLLTVPRAELPTISAESARDLIGEIATLLAKWEID